MAETKKSLFEDSPSADWETRIFEVMNDPGIEYDEKRLDTFVKRAFVGRGSLDKTYRPSKKYFIDFSDAVVATSLERAAYHYEDEDVYKRQIAEIAFILDGLHGLEYPELGRTYRSSLTGVAREGAFTAWRGAIGRAVKEVRYDLEHPNEIKAKEQDAIEETSKGETSASKKKEVYVPLAEPDYSDPEDVVKYLFSVGIISPSHAKALLVTLGYQRPEGEISDSLKNDMQRIRNDLRARIAVYKHGIMLEEAGTHILESFIAKSATNPNLKLILGDEDAMYAAGRALDAIHRIDNFRGGTPRISQDKYSDMKISVPIDESTAHEPFISPTQPKSKKPAKDLKPKRYVSLEYAPQPYSESMLDPDDEEYIRIAEMYTPIFGLGEGNLKAKFRAYIDPSPRNPEVDVYQRGIVDRIVDTINRELGGYDAIEKRINDKENQLIRSLLGIADKPGEHMPKKSVSELAGDSESVQQTIYAVLRMIAILVELKRLDI